MEDNLLLRLAKEHGTPLYVYDGDMVRDRYVQFKKAFQRLYPKTRVLYAVKANSSLAILKLLAREGAGADVVSGGELFLALRAGMDSGSIIYTSNSKTLAELEFALEKKVVVNNENIEELKVLAEIAKEKRKTVRVCFRVNPDVSPKTHPKIATGLRNSKFGLHIEENLAFNAYKLAKTLDYVDVVGLHCHIGSQIIESLGFKEATEKLVDFAIRLDEELDIQLEFIDLGGGLGISYHGGQVMSPKELAEGIVPAFKDGVKRLSYKPFLVLEPGRFIVGPVGVLLARVNSVKKTPYNNFVNIDCGLNTLVRPAMYDAYHRIKVLGKEGSEETYDIAGNVCESGDILGRERRLPKVVRGDVLAILEAGAYGFSMASEYNSQPLPAEVLVRKGKAELIRKRRSYKDLTASQIIPADLK